MSLIKKKLSNGLYGMVLSSLLAKIQREKKVLLSIKLQLYLASLFMIL